MNFILFLPKCTNKEKLLAFSKTGNAARKRILLPRASCVHQTSVAAREGRTVAVTYVVVIA